MILLCSINVSAEEYDNGTFKISYDSSIFSLKCIDGGGVSIKAIDMPDDNGGHNTVLGCLSQVNLEYNASNSLSEDYLIEFKKTLASELCTGLFDVDNGISVISDGYVIGDNTCEYFMVLSDGTECYVTVYNYDKTVYYAACRLCPYTSELNDGYRSIYKSIELSSGKNTNSNNAEPEETIDWEAKYNKLLVEHETLKAKYNVLSREHEPLKEKKEEVNNLIEETETVIYEKESEQSEIENAETDSYSMIDASKNSQERLFDPSIETDIVFEDVSPFFDSKQNYNVILDNINDGRIEELKAAIGNYEIAHQDDKVLLEAILSCLNEYGDFENLVCETDSFSGETNVYYDGYTGIDTEHYLYPHFTQGKYFLRLGFVKDDWLFADKIILKRASESMEGALHFDGASYEFERDILDGGMIMEYKEESLYYTRIDKFLEDMDEEIAIRFEAENDKKLDYWLTENDKKALQNVAKYSKLVLSLSEIYKDNELYYSNTAGEGIISGRNSDANSFQFNVELINKYSDYSLRKYYAYFDFLLTNNYSSPITEINGLGIFIDPHGKEIKRIYFDFKNMEIHPGSSLEKQMYYECKSYEEIYDIQYDDITVIYIPEYIVFSDGTMEEF